MDVRTNLFSGSGKLRGLSGGAGSAVALDDRNAFYNFRLRRHYTDDDLTAAPIRIWATNDDPDARTGLGPHLVEVMSDGERFTDVLIVLSEDDWDNASRSPGSEARLVGVLRQEFEEMVRATAGHLPERPLGVWVVCDGSAEVGGTSFGLVEGEFITGVTPNLYRQPGPRSKPILAVLAYLPGHTDDYVEVGRLYDDQLVFTLGNHWLDNFRHPSLREAALYRIQHEDDGAFFHILNPDLQSSYQLASTEQDGESVITLATWEGEALAYLRLEVVDGMSSGEPSLGLSEARPVAPRPHAERPPASLEAAPTPVSAPRGVPSRTILPEAQDERIFTLQERGALLQKVHFSSFMLGYDVYLGGRGELGTVVHQPAATFEVRKTSVSVLAHADGVSLNGETVPKGESRLIDGDSVIQVGNQRLEYNDLRGVTLEGWPYVGEVRRPAASTYLLWGRDYPVGRSRDCRIVLPDEPRNDNIVWKPKVVDGAMIKSRNGDIPKARFYTDSIMVASEHAAIDLTRDDPELVGHARMCFSFVRRDGDILPVHPTEGAAGPTRQALLPGDEILIGNCVFHAGFTTLGEEGAATPAAPAPSPLGASASWRGTSDSLVDAVSLPDFAEAPPDVFDEVEVLPELSLLSIEDSLPDPVEAAPVPRIEPSAEASLRAARRGVAEAAPAPVEAAQSVEAVAPVVTPPPEVVAVAAPPPVVAPNPVVAPPPVVAPLAVSRSAAAGGVVVVDDQDAQFELGRPARLVLVGWSVNGTVTCGNHEGADLVIPENRVEPEQQFTARAYFTLKIRGRKGSVDVLDATEARLDGVAGLASVDSVDGRVLSVVRRDAEGEEDFTVDLRVVEDASLPDPRARLVAVDASEPLAVALSARGFPLRAPRDLVLGAQAITGTFDGARLVVSDYLATYRGPDGFRPLFVSSGGGRFRTAPEDGAPFSLVSGDRLIVGSAVYRLEAD